MSYEHAPASPERAKDTIDTSVEVEKNLNRLKEAAENSPEFDKQSLEKLQHDIKDKALGGKEYTVGESQETSSPQAVSKQLKQDAYQKTLKHVRRHLSGPERTFSRIIHQPTVEKVSSVGSQTVGRSSGLLGGSIFAFAGSLGLVVLAKHSGFTYNYLAFLLLFVLGYAIGLLLEAVIRLLVRPAKR